MNQLTTKVANSGAKTTKTMSSVELVSIINELRDEGRAELRHADFLIKCEKVLGEGVRKFSDTYIHQQNGQKYACYHLPKRECELMVMSESYAVQAKVYDRMTELETMAVAAKQSVTLHPAEESAHMMARVFKSFSESGIEYFAALTLADQAATKATGVSILRSDEPTEQPGPAHVRPTIKRKVPRPAPKKEDTTGYYSVSGLAKLKCISVEGVNLLLQGRRYQTRLSNGDFQMTLKGKKFGMVTKSGDLLWLETAIS